MPPIEFDHERDARTQIRKSGAKAWAVVVDSQAGRDQEPVQLEDFTALRTQLNLDVSCHPTRVCMLAPGLIAESDQDVLSITLIWDNRILWVTLALAGELASPWPQQGMHHGYDLVRDAVARSLPTAQDPGSLGQALTDRVRNAGRQGSLRELAEATERTIAVIDGRDEAAAAQLLSDLLEIRARHRQLIALESRDGMTVQWGVEYSAAIGDVDALATFVAGRQMMSRNDRARLDEAAARVHEVRITRLATALVLPAIWVTFWGTKSAPDVKGPIGWLLVLGVALAIGVGAWALMPGASTTEREQP